MVPVADVDDVVVVDRFVPTTGSTVEREVFRDELAAFCLNALAASGDLSSKAAVQRIVRVTLDGLRARA